MFIVNERALCRHCDIKAHNKSPHIYENMTTDMYYVKNDKEDTATLVKHCIVIMSET
jgi:hypothetical protein